MTTEYSPDVVAKSFIRQYYELIASSPHELYRFYKEDSFFTHTMGHQAAEVYSGTDKIRARVKEMDLAGASFDLSEGTVDAHKSENAGIFVLVTGHCTLQGEEPAQFVQSFFLAVQTESPVAYYVRNSVLRLFPQPVGRTEAVAAAPPAVQSTGVDPSPAPEQEPVPAPVVAEPVPVPAPEASVAAPRDEKKRRGKKESPAPVAAPEPIVMEPEPEPMIMESAIVMIEDITGELAGTAASENAALQDISNQLAEVAEMAMDSGPKSYADLFKRGKKEEVQPVAAGSKDSKKSRSVTGGRARSGERASPVGAPKAEAAAAPAQGKPVVGVSLYVKQLPADISVEDLLRIFVGAHKADIHSSKGYGFIEFPEPVFAASTMTRYQEDPSLFSYNGLRLKVEERSVQPKPVAAPSSGKSAAAAAPRGAKGEVAGKQNKQNDRGNASSAGKKNANKGTGASDKEAGWAVKGSSGKK